MRVLIVDPTGFGGICHYTYNLCQALSQEGLDVILVTAQVYDLIRLPRKFKLKNIFRDVSIPNSKQLFYLPKIFIRRLNLILDFLALLMVILKTKPNIVHFQWFRTYRPDYYYLKFLRIIGVKTVLTAHEVVPEFVNPDKYDKYASRLYQSLYKLIALTEPGKISLISRYHVSPKLIHLAVIPHGDYLFFNSIIQTDVNFRDEFGLESNDKVVLFFGRITCDKGLDQLLYSFKIVQDRLPNAKLLIGGVLIENFEPYKKIIYELGLSNNVRIFTKSEVIPFNKIPGYFQAADIVALPYRYSCQSGILEIAFAMSKPVVATDVGVLKSAVANGAGFVVPPGDIRQMAECIIAILENDGLRKQMSIKAREAAQQNRSWQTIARDFLNVYKSI